jgi:hypothetical protein
MTMSETPTPVWAIWAAFHSHLPPLPPAAGPFATLGVFPYAPWVLAALAAVLPAAWVTRALLAAALALSVGVVVAGGLTSYLAPPLPTLIPLCCLGVLAFARRAAGSLWVRLAPTIAMAATAAATLAHNLPMRSGWEVHVSHGRLQDLAIVLIAGTVGTGLAYRFWRDARGLWAALILLTPAVLLYDLPRTYPLGGYSLWQVAGRATADTAVTVTLGYLAARAAGRRRMPQVCPACGHPLAPAPPRPVTR